MPLDASIATRLVDATVKLADEVATDDLGTAGVSVCAIMADDENGERPDVRHMAGVKPASQPTARNKALTVIWYDANTQSFADKLEQGGKLYGDGWTTADVIAATNACPFFCPWDGGIKVYMENGLFIAALAVSGRTALGDRRLAAMAAHSLGYKTDFDDQGYTRLERQRLGRHPLVDD